MSDRTPLEWALARQKDGPYLTAEEETALARTVRVWLDGPAPTLAVIRAGRRARDELVTRNLRLVAQFVMRRRVLWQHTSLEFEDVMSFAVRGLMRAAEGHNLDGKRRFTTYASWWIRAFVARGIQDEGRTIRVPGVVQGKLSRVHKGLEPHDHLSLAAEAAHRCTSLDVVRTLSHGDEIEGFDPPAPPPPPEPDHELLERIRDVVGAEHRDILEAAYEGHRVTPMNRKMLRERLSTLGESPRQILQAA